MRKKNIIQWESIINGKHYTFKLKKMSRKDVLYPMVKGKYLLSINNEEIVIRNKSTGIFVKVDEPFSFDNKIARLVKLGKEIDVVYNSVYLQSKKRYIATPKWVWFFVSFCLLAPIIRGGPFALAVVVIGLGGSFVYYIISKKKAAPLYHDIVMIIGITPISSLPILFFTDTFTIPLLIKGGVVPFVFGIIGAYLCVQIARYDISILFKILFCTMIVIFSWFLILISLGFLSRFDIL